MTYKMLNTRNAGGYFGEEELPLAYALDGSEEDGFFGESGRGAGIKYGRRARPRTQPKSDELEELCW